MMKRCPNCYRCFEGKEDFCSPVCEEQKLGRRIQMLTPMDEVARMAADFIKLGMYERRKALMVALNKGGYRVTRDNMSALGRALAARKQAKKNKAHPNQLSLF